MKNSQIIISGAVVYKDYRGKRQFFIVKQKDEDSWQIPKITVRKAESSVRASIRMMGEIAGMNAKVLEEAGRASSVVTINGKTIPQKIYYYLMFLKSAGEVLGFEEYDWLEYSKAVRKLSLKREKDALKGAKDVLKEIERNRKKSN